jgi:hypothetical protein
MSIEFLERHRVSSLYFAILSKPESMALSLRLGRCHPHTGALAWFRVSFRCLIRSLFRKITRLLDDLSLVPPRIQDSGRNERR